MNGDQSAPPRQRKTTETAFAHVAAWILPRIVHPYVIFAGNIDSARKCMGEGLK